MKSITNGQNRRDFLKRVAGLGGALLVGGCAGQSARTGTERAEWADQIGVQLYTLREAMAEDFEGTVERVAEIGYDQVEFAGYYDRTPAQVRALLDRVGLRAPSTHVGLEALREDLEGQIEAAQTVGHRYITIPALPGAFGGQIAADDWHRYAEEFNRIGAATREAGIGLAYHNHAFEFVPAGEGMTGFDVLLTETDPELVSYELDLMWTVLAGHDPVALFERYPGRFVMWHVKDLENIEASREAGRQGMQGFRTIMENIAAVGTGEIDFARIFAHAEASGLEHFFVENDAPEDAFQDVATSYENLQDLLAAG